MRFTSLSAMTLLTAAVGAVIATAPNASAADAAPQTCSYSPNTSQCQSRGNVQINASPPPVQFHPYGGLKYLTGHNND